MAAGDVTVAMGTPICWAGSGYSSTLSGIAQTSGCDITLANLADNGARAGVKYDFGANRAPSYAVQVCLEWSTAPTAQDPVHILWYSSAVVTAAVGNTGGATTAGTAYILGTDSAWVSPDDTEAGRLEYMRHFTRIGTFIPGLDICIQTQMVNPEFVVPTRFGGPVVFNQSGQVLNAADGIEMYLALIPQTPNAAQA